MADRIFEKPVAWLLGKQLLGGLKGILLYTAYGEKLDPRDWMTGKDEVFGTNEKDEFWFDYLSDAGDGTKAMYSIAYLAMCSLSTKLTTTDIALPDNEDDRKLIPEKPNGQTFHLPRGEFLFVGGDTSYHTAEYLTLVNRFQRPFAYAYQDLRNRELISDEPDPRRPIFGIPGNHDYYDQVDGFRRQFRKPVRPEGPLPPKDGPYRSTSQSAVLTVAGFKRAQEASYVAIRLPFDWWFWGLDTEPGLIDRRQRKFFHTLPINRSESESIEAKVNGKRISIDDEFVRIPKKLIVATCSPSTVFGRVASEEDFKATGSMQALGLEVQFAPTSEKKPKPDPVSGGDSTLVDGQCRLDLSGDVHHYARYWGPQAGGEPRERNSAPRPTAQSYASVVSGAGGAFHHPTPTYDNEICEQVLYPPEAKSRAEVAKSLFKFWNVMTGGYVWLAGFIMAFVIYFCIVTPESSRQFINHFGVINALDVTHTRGAEDINATVIRSKKNPCEAVKPFVLWTALGIANGEWQPENCKPESPGYIFTDPRPSPVDLKFGQGFIVVSVAVIALTFFLGLFTKTIFDSTKNPFEEGTNPDRKLVPIVGITAPLMIIGLLSVQPYRYHITPFVSSLIVLFAVFAGVTAVVLNVRYGEYLFKQSFVKRDAESTAARFKNMIDELIPWLLWILAIVVITFGLWFYGQNNLPAFLVSDILFIVVLILAIVGIMLLPFKVAADLLYTKPKWIQVVGKFGIGLWHLILQLLVPFVLILNANYVTWILAIILLFIPIPLAQWLLTKNYRIALTFLWFVYGVVMLSLPWKTARILSNFGYQYSLIFPRAEGWHALFPATIAGIIGAIICCLWTGWYFAVSFVFNGHNNEVGGTARIENFKEFIRFRLTRDGLTGYVIAVDDVSIINEKDKAGRTMDGSDLKVKLIDVFHLVPKGFAAKTSSKPATDIGANTSSEVVITI